MQGTLNKNNPIIQEIKIDGRAAVCVSGSGSIRFLRSLAGGEYQPMTNEQGEPLEFFGHEVVFNSEILNPYPQAKFAIELIDGDSVQYTIAKP